VLDAGEDRHRIRGDEGSPTGHIKARPTPPGEGVRKDHDSRALDRITRITPSMFAVLAVIAFTELVVMRAPRMAALWQRLFGAHSASRSTPN
jgi:hypothetical protein